MSVFPGFTVSHIKVGTLSFFSAVFLEHNTIYGTLLVLELSSHVTTLPASAVFQISSHFTVILIYLSMLWNELVLNFVVQLLHFYAC